MTIVASPHLQGGEAARIRARNGALMHRVIGYALHRRDKARGEGEGKKYWQGAATVLCWLKAQAFSFGDLAIEVEAKRTALLHRIRRYIRRRDQRAEKHELLDAQNSLQTEQDFGHGRTRKTLL